jgi:4'-phosphopantetheinyl transferase
VKETPGDALTNSPRRVPIIRYVRTAGLPLDRLRDWGLPLLSPGERSAFERLKPPASKRDYLAAHLLLRLTVGRLLGTAPEEVRLASDITGRPVVSGEHVEVSLSHCLGLGACAVAPGTDRIGVDAEPFAAAAQIEEVTGLVLSPSELAWSQSVPRELCVRQVALWTAKEAVLKSRGEGIGSSDGGNALAAIECRIESWQGDGTGRFRTQNERIATVPLPGDFCLAWARPGVEPIDRAVPEEAFFPLPVA